jgi:hypothetical protein
MVLIGGKITLSYAPNGPVCCGVVMPRNVSGESTGAFWPLRARRREQAVVGETYFW